MPSENIIALANFMAQQLVPIGYKVGTGEPNSIVIYLTEFDKVEGLEGFTNFVNEFMKRFDKEIIETTQFHFYREKWLGGVVFEPKLK